MKRVMRGGLGEPRSRDIVLGEAGRAWITARDGGGQHTVCPVVKTEDVQ